MFGIQEGATVEQDICVRWTDGDCWKLIRWVCYDILQIYMALLVIQRFARWNIIESEKVSTGF